MNIRRVTVGIDFTSGSEIALAHAVHIARRAGAVVTLAHAADGAGGSAEDLSRLHARCIAQGVEVNDLPLRAPLDRALPAAAHEHGADLVAIGGGEERGPVGFFLGSAAEKVARASQAGVLIGRSRAPGPEGYNHILVPTDFSRITGAALDAAITLVARGGVIDVVHVWHLPLATAGYWVADRLAGRQRHMLAEEIYRRGSDFVEPYRRRHPKIVFDEIQDAPVAAGIEARLAERPHDLVVIGTHGRRGPKRWVLGSATDAVIRRAPCSVLAVHEPPEQRRPG